MWRLSVCYYHFSIWSSKYEVKKVIFSGIPVFVWHLSWRLMKCVSWFKKISFQPWLEKQMRKLVDEYTGLSLVTMEDPSTGWLTKFWIFWRISTIALFQIKGVFKPYFDRGALCAPLCTNMLFIHTYDVQPFSKLNVNSFFDMMHLFGIFEIFLRIWVILIDLTPRGHNVLVTLVIVRPRPE